MSQTPAPTRASGPRESVVQPVLEAVHAAAGEDLIGSDSAREGRAP